MKNSREHPVVPDALGDFNQLLDGRVFRLDHLHESVAHFSTMISENV